ncbi:hypothetical protein [Paraglaciecola sp.]|uniref:hypothetical protein n=1 Tax=Paraglaciecola sp. TaxID=1920173 RepID=UPI0030F3B001
MTIDVNKSPLVPKDTLIKRDKTTNVLKGLIALLLLFWIINDVSNRLFSVVPDNRNNMSLEQVQPIHKVQLSLSQYSQISTLYEQFNSQDATEDNQQKTLGGLSLEQQALQSGHQTKVFGGNNMLELKAVVVQKTGMSTKNTSYALVKVTDIKTGRSDVMQILNNQIVHGYKLNIIDNTHVKLIPDTVSPTASNSKVDLVLAMYRRDDNSSSGKNQ